MSSEEIHSVIEMHPCRACGKNAIWSWSTQGLCDRCRKGRKAEWMEKNRHTKKVIDIMGKLKASEHHDLQQQPAPLSYFKTLATLEQLFATLTDHDIWDCEKHANMWHAYMMDLKSHSFCICSHGNENHDEYFCHGVGCDCEMFEEK